jgi:hypothetical protein
VDGASGPAAAVQAADEHWLVQDSQEGSQGAGLVHDPQEVCRAAFP